MPMVSSRELFGGAITMELPSNLVDASDLRQIPDNQEVYLSPESDTSFILEILQRVDANDSENAAKFHFDSLAHDNSASSQDIYNIILPPGTQPPSPPATPHPIILVGRQEVRKFNSPTTDHVQIYMALFRIEAKGVDLVLTANIPQKLGDGWRIGEQFAKIFDAAAGSLRVMDFALFA